jgi:hypothetical protein
MLSGRVTIVVESSRSEINRLNLILGQVFDVDLQFLGVWFLFSHSMLETKLPIWTFSGHNKDVSLCCGHDPFAIDTHVKRSDWVTKAREQSFCVLPDLLIKSDLTIQRADGKSSSHGGRNFVELRISFIYFLLGRLVLFVQSRIKSEDSLLVHSNECVLNWGLTILMMVCQMSQRWHIYVRLELLYDLACFHVEIEDLRWVISIREQKLAFILMEDHWVWMNDIAISVFKLWELLVVDKTSLLVIVLFGISINFDDWALNNKSSVVRVSLNAFWVLKFSEFIFVFFLPVVNWWVIFMKFLPFVAINLFDSIHISILFSITNHLRFKPVMLTFLGFLEIFLVISFIQNFG